MANSPKRHNSNYMYTPNKRASKYMKAKADKPARRNRQRQHNWIFQQSSFNNWLMKQAEYLQGCSSVALYH